MAYFKYDDLYGLVVDTITLDDVPNEIEENLKYNLLEGNEDWDEKDIEVYDNDDNCAFINLSDFPELQKELIKSLYYQIKEEWDELYVDFEDIWKSFEHFKKWFKTTYKKHFHEEFIDE